MASLKATITKNGIEYILINPEKDIPFETLCAKFGKNTLKVNYLNPHFTLEGLYGAQDNFEPVEDLSGLD
ncbi:MAG: hypothetical protein AAF600_09705 [Bacteroidota bacterium]